MSVELRMLAPFLLESERVLSMLAGVDLLRVWGLAAALRRRACVNRLLHRCVYQDGVWSRAFYQEDVESLAPVLQNEHLRTLFQLVNPQPLAQSEKAQSEKAQSEKTQSEKPQSEKPQSEKTQSEKTQSEKGEVQPSEKTQEPSGEEQKAGVSLKDLSLLYKITEKQGWYKNKEGLCYFIRFKDATRKSFDVLYPAIPSSVLDGLIRQVAFHSPSHP